MDRRSQGRDQGWRIAARHFIPRMLTGFERIETAWRELRARLADTEPVQMEDREAVVKRLRLAVTWVNWNRRMYLRGLCWAPKERARDVLKLQGGRAKH